MNNEQANIDVSTVDVEEEKHVADGSADVGQEVVSEAEASAAVQSVAAADVDVEGQEEVASNEEGVVADDSGSESAAASHAAAAAVEVVADDSGSEGAVVPPEESGTSSEESAVALDEFSDQMSLESLEAAYDNSIKAFTDGEIVEGIVVDVARDEVMIDIGFKSEGYIPASEFDSGEDGLPAVKVGDAIDVYIVRREDSEGQIVLSKRIADQTLIWNEIATAHEQGTPVAGHITERIKGGLRVNVGSLRGFLPASQVELRPIQNLEQYLGQTLDMKVINVSKRRHNIVLSRRAWLEAQLVQKRAEVLSKLEIGQQATGVVKNITAFGAFVDLGGVDGLLHKTDMAWRRVHHPSDIVSVGEEVEVQVIAINRENEKISLGLKQKTPDPWLDIEEKYPVGSTVRGVVVNIVNYGAFLQLEEGVEGLIHVSEMAWTRRNIAPSRIVNKGDEIEVIVLDISKVDKRISLGLKQLQENPWVLLEQRAPVGSKITGRIRNLTNFGVFVEIEPGIDGLIHTSDLSWTKRGSAASSALKEGNEIEVVVLQIDASERRVSLGLKQTQPDPWAEVPEKYKVGSVVRGKVVNLTSFGVFTKLEEGIEGLIHISELANRRIDKPEEIVSVGDELDLKVISLSPEDRRIGLSLKALVVEQERAAAAVDERPAKPRSERGRRSRSRREREPRTQLPSHEEPVTTLGTLLQVEMGKSNADQVELVESTESIESVEIVESAESTESVDPTESAEDVGSADQVKPAESDESVEPVENVGGAENAENVESTGNPESTEDSEN